jgi:hypothetical protein
MPGTPTHDMVNNVFNSVSSPAAASAAATVDGAAVDCTGVDGPIHALVHLGASANTPTTISVVSKLQESDDGSTSWTDCPSLSVVSALTAVNTSQIIRAVRTKKYCRTRKVVSFTGGSSPTVVVGSTLMGQKRTY